jgi:hypothetical protein
MEISFMELRKLAFLFLASTILFASSVPVYASHVKKEEPSAEEKMLFEKIFSRLEEHADMMKVQVEDVRKSFSEPVEISFSCMPFRERAVDSVSVNVVTQFARFQPELSEGHRTGILGGIYVWDCKAVKEKDVLTIQCVNTLMLNPDFLVREENETGERKTIAMAENEMVLYHELLHGELMIDAINDVSDVSRWRKNACTFFAENNNELDYTPSDLNHALISSLELDFLAKIVKKHNGLLLVKNVDRHKVGSYEFTEIIATFPQLGTLAKKGFFVMARAINVNDVTIDVSQERGTIAVSGSLSDPSIDGSVRVFIMPKTVSSDVRISLDVDNAVKGMGSEFIFTARVHNADTSDASGTLKLGLDGRVVSSRNVEVKANSEIVINFAWKSSNVASKHVAAIDGFGTASNELTLFTFDELEVNTIDGEGMISEQVIVDSDSGERTTVARPSKISAVAIVESGLETIRLLAPSGTIVIGKDGLVREIDDKVRIVSVDGKNLAVRYSRLNDRVVFTAVKNTISDEPLPVGVWRIMGVDSNGINTDARIKYYVSFLAVMR